MGGEIFRIKEIKRQVAEIEFRHFKSNCEKVISNHKLQSQHFRELDTAFTFYDLSHDSKHFQVGFQKRFSGYYNHKGEIAYERGTQLVYSQAPSGHTACMLYPAKSNTSNVLEDMIFLRSGHFTGHQLLSHLKKDLNDLEAYLFVSSTDLTPKWRPKLRIGWLRRTHPLQLDGQHVRPKLFGYIGKASDFTFRTMLISLFKPIGFILVVIMLTALNLSPLVDILNK